MLKYLSIFFAVFAVVKCDDGDPPPGECKSCDDTIKTVFEMAASFAKGMEPIEINDVQICKKVVVTGPSTLTSRGDSCMISEGANKWQQCGLSIKKLNVECHIIPLKEFMKFTGLNIPIPSISIPGFGSNSKVHQIIVINATDVNMDFVSRINFDEDSCNITKLEMEQGNVDSMLFSLRGDAIFTKMGELITSPKIVRASIGYVIKFVLRHVMSMFMNDPKLKEVITMLNCGDTDY